MLLHLVSVWCVYSLSCLTGRSKYFSFSSFYPPSFQMHVRTVVCSLVSYGYFLCLSEKHGNNFILLITIGSIEENSLTYISYGGFVLLYVTHVF